MKKLFRLLLSVLLLAGLSACGTEAPPADAGDSSPDGATSADSGSVPGEEATDVRTYENPLIHVNDPYTWWDYGVGDPFVLRWNGRYYLYCSTKDGETGIQCWESENLTEWKFRGLCAEESLTVSAYAPEVVYYNGAFYMYTSPAGNGHYVLKSDAPTGPFTAVTGNFGLSIDGDVFIDDDGKWYFYTAGGGGIMAYTMSAPDRVNTASGVKTGAYMNGWTEGSMILKHGGIYYMTYTGNHVWCDGYRIDCAVSRTSPLTFTPLVNNPILLSTDADRVKGIGHSSTVGAPDLDGYYIVYHSSPVAPMREMNIDRIVLNGSRLDVLGPTVTEQEAPAMPRVYSHFDRADDLADWRSEGAAMAEDTDGIRIAAGGYALSRETFTGDYTAEINLLSLTGRAGAVFSCADPENYGLALYDAASGCLSVSFTVSGKTEEHSAKVPTSFGETLRPDALIQLTVRRIGDTYSFAVNGHPVLEEDSALTGGTAGALSLTGEATFGFIGISDAAGQSGVKRMYKPVEGLLPAITCAEEQVKTKAYGGVRYLTVRPDETYSYYVNTAESCAYDLAVTYRSAAGAELEILDNGTPVGRISLPKTHSTDGTAILRDLPLQKGFGVLTFRVLSGGADILSYELRPHGESTDGQIDLGDPDAVLYKDGNWTAANGTLTLQEGCGKWLTGDPYLGDYTVEAEITPLGDGINFGLLLRTQNPSVGGAGDDVAAGTDFLQGYFVGLGNGNVFLGRHNYNWQQLASASAKVKPGKTYRLTAMAEGSVIRVWLDGVLLIEYDDPTPFLWGAPGLRGHFSSARVSSFTVRCE